MSRSERAFCCGTRWRSSSTAIARELRAQSLERDVLEIGADSGSVARQLLSLHGLTVDLQSRLCGHVMRFVAQKN